MAEVTKVEQQNQGKKQKQTPGFTEFYLGVLYGSAYNFFTPRNKFKISWSDANPNYNSTYGPAAQYKTLSKQILEVFQNFKLYIDHIDLPGLQIKGGDVIDDGKGPYYMQGDHMLSPETNEVVVWFRETMISIADLAYIWINFNATPWIRPLKLNLNIDYYSDFDGKTSVMAYKLDGCRPIELDMINARHDGKEVLLRGIKMGFNTITPVECNGGKKGTSAIASNWSNMLEQIKKAQEQERKNNSTVFNELGKSWDQSSGFFGTIGGAASTIVNGEAVAFNSTKEETAIKDFVTDNWVTNAASKSWDFTKSVFTSDKNTEGNNVKISGKSQNTQNTDYNEDDDLDREYHGEFMKYDEPNPEPEPSKTRSVAEFSKQSQQEPQKTESSTVADVTPHQSNINNQIPSNLNDKTDNTQLPIRIFPRGETKMFTPEVKVSYGNPDQAVSWGTMFNDRDYNFETGKETTIVRNEFMPSEFTSFTYNKSNGSDAKPGNMEFTLNLGDVGANISNNGDGTGTIVTYDNSGTKEILTVDYKSIRVQRRAQSGAISDSGFATTSFSITATDISGKPVGVGVEQYGQSDIPVVYHSTDASKNKPLNYRPVSEGIATFSSNVVRIQ